MRLEKRSSGNKISNISLVYGLKNSSVITQIKWWASFYCLKMCFFISASSVVSTKSIVSHIMSFGHFLAMVIIF